MKQIFSVFLLVGFCCLSNNLRADSLVGGDIRYTYIGDSTGIPNQYFVDISIHFTSLGNWPSTNISPPQVCVQSSCFPAFSVASNLHPSMPAFSISTGNSGCLRWIDSNSLPIFRVVFRSIVNLPDTCSDIRFSVHHCCRLPATQLVNYAQNTGPLFLQASLNNTLENRSTPRFLANPFAVSYCKQRVFHGLGIDNFANDSLVLRLVPLRDGSCSDSISPTDLTFSTGFSDSIPFAIQQGSQLEVFLPGMISFLPDSINGKFAFGMEWDIYSPMPGSSGNYYHFGTIYREEVISIGSQCDLNFQSYPPSSHFTIELIPTSVLRMLPFSAQIPNTDSVIDTNSPSGYSMPWMVYEFACEDSFPTFLFGNNHVACPSISSDGSEFIVYGPDTSQIPVVSAQGECDPFGFSSRVNYAFSGRLPILGDYYVSVVKGSDNNTFFNYCGFEMTEYFSFILRNTCPPDFSVFSTDRDESRIIVYPNPNQGNFNLQAKEGLYQKAILMDFHGRIIHKQELLRESQHNFSLNSIASGQYILWLINDTTGVRDKVKIQVF